MLYWTRVFVGPFTEGKHFGCDTYLPVTMAMKIYRDPLLKRWTNPCGHFYWEVGVAHHLERGLCQVWMVGGILRYRDTSKGSYCSTWIPNYIPSSPPKMKRTTPNIHQMKNNTRFKFTYTTTRRQSTHTFPYENNFVDLRCFHWKVSWFRKIPCVAPWIWGHSSRELGVRKVREKSRQSPQVVVFDKRLEAKAVSLKHMGALK